MTIQQHTYPELTPEQIASRSAITNLKATIKDDVTRSRELKVESRKQPSNAASVAQSALASHRIYSRAHLLIYGSLRGRTWQQMENKHGEATPQLKYALKSTWSGYTGGTVIAMPTWLQELLS